LKEYIIIKGHGSISALGHDKQTVSSSYNSARPDFQSPDATPIGSLQKKGSELLEQLSLEKRAYKGLDRSVLLAMYASRQAVVQAGWGNEKDISINIGSSRGATTLFEEYISEFQRTGKVPPNTSPLTTLGNISSWVAQDLNTSGPGISHSVTCSTGLQAIANGFAWLKSGMANKFLAGAAEAPLTPFTIAQMKAIGIYSDESMMPYPCRPLNALKKNTFVLGEGAAVFALEKVSEKQLNADKTSPVIISSIGFGFENISSKTGISKEGNNFQLAILDAIENAGQQLPVDMIIMHAPGTVAGDSAELNAIRNVFANTGLPIISSSKWMTGHTLGASGCLAIEYAMHILETQTYLDFPYPIVVEPVRKEKPIRRILVVAAGFGGNAAAVILDKGR